MAKVLKFAVLSFCAAFIASKITFGAENSTGAQKFFKDEDLTLTGVYYYPEHWEESQWDRDLRNIKSLGFEFVHMAEFAWYFLEPEEGKYDFKWLDKAVALAKKNDLKIVLCTSTATPPAWLVRKYPEVLRKEFNARYDHGARQHCSNSSQKYKEISLKMINALVERYGNDTAVIGWQIDNEPFARPNEISEEARKRFQDFLEKKYGYISKLNDAWGARFWGQMYNDFSQIGFYSHNPHQYLDMMRFAGTETAEFLDIQAEAIKSKSKNQWVTTNFVPTISAPAIGRCKNLDFTSYTRYMIPGYEGLGEKGFRLGSAFSISYANDFFRPLSNGVYGVMELQPGQVNWGYINPIPMPGAVRLWLWSVWSGGSKFICTYRYREPIYGSEQYHYGVVGPDGITTTRGGSEFSKFISENAQLRKRYNPSAQKVPQSYASRRAALLYSAENEWELSKSKQSNRWNTEQHWRGYYEILKSFGAPVDIVSGEADLSKYRFVIAPAYIMMDETLVKKLRAYAENGGNLIFSIRSGYMDNNGRLYEKPFGGLLYDLTGAKRLEEFDMLPGQKYNRINAFGKTFEWGVWAEIFTPSENTEVWGRYADDFYAGKAAVLHRKLGKGSVTYVGAQSKHFALEREVLKKVYSIAGVNVLDLPQGVVLEYRDGFGILLNYSDKTFDASSIIGNGNIIIGSNKLSTADVTIWDSFDN